MAAKGLSVWALDLPGFGYSDKPEDFGYTLADYADFMAAFMDAEGIPQATIVGNSMGGSIAMMTYLMHPDRVGTARPDRLRGISQGGRGLLDIRSHGVPGHR